ncbi:complex I 24 kDa subunit family protein [Roseibacillus ishigakijimensis]|uniref:NAD(P)H-dependent oxidoreductase subunit E n=1 Tax=Roseibacillus ishigakijimensis TaxID=454146 RepID=A0A934RSE3_9BACT|nr:NAD(P)H-dependent oxidoreductase subunit E [Roseibacillus ishigakijimensis]MBK1833661.1 NAD(P)H-dependent oxidoreductase subunit E [Roseibacillus ishigakijimensis]
MSQSILDKTIASPETPGTKHFPPFNADDALNSAAAEAISHYPEDQKRSAVLPLLHLVQHRFGYISAPAIDWVAQQLGIEPIKVVEVVTFYPGLRQAAPGKFHIRVCRTLSCAMAGSYELMEKLAEATQIDRSTVSHANPIAVSPCGNYSVEFAECLASCGTGPVCMVNDDFHEAVDPAEVAKLLANYPKSS